MTSFKKLNQVAACHRKRSIVLGGGPFKEFTDSIKAGKKAGSDFSYAADFTETALLGLVAIQAGTKIKYNAKKMRVTNNKEANKYLMSQYDYKSGFIPS